MREVLYGGALRFLDGCVVRPFAVPDLVPSSRWKKNVGMSAPL